MDKARLAELLRDPRETLELEIKGWLDATSKEHRAVVAKACIALANHGGGHVLIGMTADGDTFREDANRPAKLDVYSTDWVNGIVEGFAEPAFHCEVRFASAQADGPSFPIISVPGGHVVPIRAKRSGPNDKIIHDGTYYIRRPGPKSEPPQSAREWDELIQRCLHNRRDEMLDHIRVILSGSASSVPVEPEDPLPDWESEGLRRWQAVLADAQCPKESPAAMPHGYWTCSYRVIGEVVPRRGQELIDLLVQAKRRHTGWPAWWVPTRGGIAPYPIDGVVECWIARDGAVMHNDPSHADFWRASPDGKLFLLRGYGEDGLEKIGPGKVFDVSLPVWRIGECLLHAAEFARLITNGDDQAKVDVHFTWTGLKGRNLTSVTGRRALHDDKVSFQDEVRARGVFQATTLPNLLPEAVAEMTQPLYEVFDFFKPSQALVVGELGNMRKNQF